MWTSESFEPKLSHSYTFYGLLEVNRISVCVLDETNAELVALQELELSNSESNESSIAQNWKKLIANDLDFKQVRLAVLPKSFTLCPLGEKQSATALAKFELGECHENQTWLVKENKFGKLQTVSKVATPSVSYFETKIPNTKTVSGDWLGINAFRNLSKFQNKAQCYWVYSPNNSLVFLFNKGELLLANSFTIGNTEDILYYSFNMFEQLELNQQNVEVIFSGQLNKLNLQKDLCNKYLSNWKLANEVAGLKADLIGESAISRNFALLNFFRCE